ncbi:hypothetical protein GCM10011392_40080 [Wenxinia marina]|uniref:Uncharacterized protein n=1 Tax=Wenxinia marina DSM 24838 TaxID=1123501 RepID=A0A0D0QG65_9RHOB|nr:hypothetical protein Wenmar_00611 [Wenxinia marina DSM 24838]GGL81437.1 hypothetical protein GCM10011392_40080 [Wenxinia marina]
MVAAACPTSCAASSFVAVSTSAGYGVSEGGQTSLSSAPATCAPGVFTVSIDDGFGAAGAPAKMVRR